MHTLVLYTVPPQDLPRGRTAGEFDLIPAAQEVVRLLSGATLAGVQGAAREILGLLETERPDIIFNLCEAPLGRPEFEPQVPALLEWLGMRFTGSGSETLSLCRRKDRTKAVLAAAGIPVPRADGFPCIVKPLDQDGSTGIDAESICHNPQELERARARLPGPVLVEAFLPGKEFVIAVWGRIEPTYLSIGEADFTDGLKLFTYAAKWFENSADYAHSLLQYHTKIDSSLRASLIEIARSVWRVVAARGYLRVDVRLDAQGLPCVLDVNPNPDMMPDMAMCRAVNEAGWTWERFVRQQVEWALDRSPEHQAERAVGWK
jgi:D-alanine-D-alanine ligase